MNRTASADNQRTTTPTSISLEGPLLQAGKQKAKKNRQSFSSYVAMLLERDMEKASRVK
jgi:hypothetical protein